MLQDSEIDRMAGVQDRYQAADALGLVLYGRKGSRFQAFRMAFLQGVEDATTSRWIEPRGIGPSSVGYQLGAVFYERA